MVVPDRDDAQRFRERFERHDAVNSVAVAANGDEALDFGSRCGEDPDAAVPNLVLLELDLPESSGYEVLSELKAMPDFRSVPVIVMSDADDAERVSRSYECNANAHISKPSTEAEFEQFVELLERFWFDMVQLPRSTGN